MIHECNDIKDWKQKNQLIHTTLVEAFGKKIKDGDGVDMECGEYTSPRYCGIDDDTPDLWSVNGKPCIKIPKNKALKDIVLSIPLEFNESLSILKNED